MGRQIIELVQVLVDRIEKNGYQQRAREDDIADVYKRLNEAEGQAKHWRQARQDAIAAGELMKAEIVSLREQIDAQQQDVDAMRAECERLRTFVGTVRSASSYFRGSTEWHKIEAALDELDAQPAPVAETAEKRWFRSQVQIKECVSRATDGKLNKEAIEVWVSGQPADWTQTIKRADGQIPEWVWESVSRHMVCHVETRFNRQTEMMEFRNWEVFDKPTPVAEPLDAEGVQ